jgi:hypothetical protein
MTMATVSTPTDMIDASVWLETEQLVNVVVPPAKAALPHSKKRIRSLTRPLPQRPARADLERACRIALMEAQQPASIEVIYDRIVRRGSLQFFAYKSPFRALASALSALVRRGEARVLVHGHGCGRGAARRLWCCSGADSTL